LDNGASSAEALAAATAAAREAADATVDMVAKRGRASYTGERSRGSVDAGATAVAVLAERISETWQK
jgi:dihydroxyacetone kinase